MIGTRVIAAPSSNDKKATFVIIALCVDEKEIYRVTFKRKSEREWRGVKPTEKQRILGPGNVESGDISIRPEFYGPMVRRACAVLRRGFFQKPD